MPRTKKANTTTTICPRCGGDAPHLNPDHSARTEAVMRAAIAVCAKKATVQDLDQLRSAVADLDAPPSNVGMAI